MSFSEKSLSLLQRDIFLFFLNLLMGVAVARILGPEMMGLWVILLLIPGYAEAFGRLKFDIAAVYFLGKKKAKMGEMVFILNFLALLTSLILVSFFLLNFDWFYSRLFHSSALDMHLPIYIILLIIPLQFIFLNYSYLYIHCENITVFNRMYIIDSLISSAGGLIMLLILDWGILGVLLGKVLGLFFAIIYSGIKFTKIERMKVKMDFRLILKMAKYSIQFYLGGVISHLHIYITNLLTALYLAPGQVAFFSMAKGRCEMLTRLVPSAIGTLLFPKVSKSEDSNQSMTLTARAFRVTFLLLIFIGIILAIAIKPIVYILYGKDYLPLTIPFWIVLPGLVLSQSTSVFNNYFSGRGRPDLIPKIAIVPMVIQGLLAFSLIPLMGIVGASISFLASTTALGMVQLLIFLNVSHCSYRDILLKKDDFYTIKDFIRTQINRITSRNFGKRNIKTDIVT